MSTATWKHVSNIIIYHHSFGDILTTIYSFDSKLCWYSVKVFPKFEEKF